MEAKEEMLGMVVDLYNGRSTTLRGYFIELLYKLWEDEENFSGKRPFGNSGWKYEIYQALLENELVDGKLDENGYVDTIDIKAADKLILDLICEL